MKVLNILGSTGSIGKNTLDIVALHPNNYKLNLISGGSNWEMMLDQISKFQPKYAYLHDTNARKHLKDHYSGNTIIIDSETEYHNQLEVEHDITICAILGIAALRPTLHSVIGAKVLGLANKEVVICAYPFLKRALDENKVRLIPLDSEHNAIYQIIGFNTKNVRDVVITASGGPFYEMDKMQFYNASPADAVRHPNWSMGAKISVDTATLMNKGLEYIEACELFELDSNRVKILVHRTSTVHAIVNFIDGSSVLQVNEPDMKVHISKALEVDEGNYVALPNENFDFTAMALAFEHLDNNKFELPALARQVYESNDLSARIKLNNVNEILVHQYLNGQIKFGDIIENLKKSIHNHQSVKMNHLDDLFEYSNKIYADYT